MAKITPITATKGEVVLEFESITQARKILKIGRCDIIVADRLPIVHNGWIFEHQKEPEPDVRLEIIEFLENKGVTTETAIALAEMAKGEINT